jgi:hypothetical protein
MTIKAFFAQPAIMRVCFLMAFNAFLWCVPIFDLGLMAGDAFNILMIGLNGEIRLFVIEEISI